ncbi:MAG: plasmid pRiA4b ORF-3 family protein [Acidobacteria bacterium]|nr:plasmid pRiA4b ORF-3 family protein [Acidobacteriota bacterium]
MSSTQSIYQIKVTLRHSKPPIWRRLLVSGGVTLNELHKIIQIAMGWTNSHLHQFIIAGEFFSIPNEEDWKTVIDEREYRLAELVPVTRSKFLYEYDFGDGWQHDILVENILPPDPGAKYPHCVTGKRACPPEDVGGIWGFEEFLEAMRDPEHEEHESYMEWCGEPYDPEELDREEINEGLKDIDGLFEWRGEM